MIASRGFIYPTNLYTYSLPISQVGLLALWAGLGKTPFWIRLPVLVAGAASWSWLLRQGEGTVADQWFLVLSVEATLTLALVLVARLCGINVKQLDPGDVAVQNEEKVRLRFSLRDVFVLVTAVCVCLGGMPLLVENWNALNVVKGDTPMLLAWCNVWAVLSFLTIWLALGRRYAIFRGVVFCLLIAGFLAVNHFNLEHVPHRGAAWITAEHLVLTYLSLIVLRLGGYRVIARQ